MDEKLRNYQQLINLDRQDLVRNVEPFDCPICMTAFGAGEGAVLRECLHTFCRWVIFFLTVCKVFRLQIYLRALIKSFFFQDMFDSYGSVQ